MYLLFLFLSFLSSSSHYCFRMSFFQELVSRDEYFVKMYKLNTFVRALLVFKFIKPHPVVVILICEHFAWKTYLGINKKFLVQ
jgi:hypothetical protein